MRLLLDTHALIWLLGGDERLSQVARRHILTDADVTFASAASAWEIATKYRLGKLPSARELALDFTSIVQEAGLEPLSISVRHGELAGRFEDPHRDPFDRMLVAQAIEDELVLISNEALFDRFGVRRAW